MLGVGWGLQETMPQVRAQGTCVFVGGCVRERLLSLRWIDRQGGAAGPQSQFSSDG